MHIAPCGPARSPRDTLVATTAPAAGEPAAAHAATVTELAEILHLAAERSQSTYLRAVADSFTELSDRLASGTVSETEAERTSQELAQHLLAAAREVGGAFQQAIESSLADGAVADDSGVVLDPAASDSAEASLNQAGAATAAQSVGVAATEAVPSIYMAFDKVIAEYEYDPISLGLRPPGAELSSSRVESDIYGGVLTAQTDPNAPAPEAPFAGRVQGEGGGDVAGAAERSSDGAGDAAGAGGAELSAAPAIADGPVDTAVAALPQNERTDGRFAEVELLPDVPDGFVAVPLTLGAGQTFVRAAESSSAARGIGGTYRDVVARYFTPAAGSPGATE